KKSFGCSRWRQFFLRGSQPARYKGDLVRSNLFAAARKNHGAFRAGPRIGLPGDRLCAYLSLGLLQKSRIHARIAQTRVPNLSLGLQDPSGALRSWRIAETIVRGR